MECSLTINHNQNRTSLGRGKKGPLVLVVNSNFPWEEAEPWLGQHMVGTRPGWLSLGLDVPAFAMRRVEVI